MESAGAAIAVHGYQHRCHALGASLLRLDRRSEFAGVDSDTQRAWIRAGFEILRGKRLDPRLWIAPRHGFDRNTLIALQAEDVEYISDGFARVPHRRHGVIWIPQQLWSPIAKSKGLWTICIHPHTAKDTDVERLRCFLKSHGPQFTSFDRVVKEFEGQSLGWKEQMYERLALRRVQARRRRHMQGRL